MDCPHCKSATAKRNGGGRARCSSCRKSWDVEPAPAAVTGASTLYGADGEVRLTWVKTERDKQDRSREIEALVRASVEKLPKLKPRLKVGTTLPRLMAGYPIGDLHVGMRAWADECGESWDLDIAEQVQCSAMAALVENAPKAEVATIVDLGDWYHYDSLEPVTTRSGHILDADSRYAKMIGVGMKIMRRCIESALRRHDQVNVICLQGNHNETGALWMSLALSHLYEQDNRVTVDASPALFRYFRHGKTLVGCHHGHTCKADKLPGVMAADRSKDWGETNHRYWWLGHVHHQAVKEHPGVIVESFNTLAAKDAYATAGGWRAQRNMKCIVLHDEHGEVARHTINAAMVET